MRRRWWCAAACIVLAACSDGSSGGGAGQGGSSGAAGTGGAGATGGSGGTGGLDAGHSPHDSGADAASSDAGTAPDTDAGPWAVPGFAVDLPLGAPIDAPAGQWTYVPFDDARCANGTTTGILVKPHANPQGLFIFLAGGGACWDATTCLELDASVHLHETVGETIVRDEANGIGGLFDQTSAINPFKDYASVYVPYCTGDLHSGTRAVEYTGASGPVTLQHTGGLNVDAYLARLAPTFASVPRVILAGSSAGGFGATLNWWRVQAAFSHARVDVWDDAGLLVDPKDERFAVMTQTWAARLPPGCAECGQKLSAWLPFYAGHMTAPRRYALTGFLGDSVIGTYFGLSAAEIETRLQSLRTATAANQKTFYLTGTLHSVVGDGLTTTASDGASIVPWLMQLVGDDAAWDHAGP